MQHIKSTSLHEKTIMMQPSPGAKYVTINSESSSYWNKCLICYTFTLHIDCICHNCKKVVPKHIPNNQVRRFIERRNEIVARKTISKGE
jgi:hypothetical protein